MPMPSVAPNDVSEVVADPVLERRGRRSFSMEFKRRIVAQAAACHGHGEVAALLRREGLYSSHLSIWRAQAVAAKCRVIGVRSCTGHRGQSSGSVIGVSSHRGQVLFCHITPSARCGSRSRSAVRNARRFAPGCRRRSRTRL